MLTEFYSRAMCFNMAPRTRFELVIVESKSTVLPLHYQGTFGTQIFKDQLGRCPNTKNPLTFQVEGFGK